MNNVRIVSGEQQRDSVIRIHIHSSPNSPPIQVTEHRAKSGAPFWSAALQGNLVRNPLLRVRVGRCWHERDLCMNYSSAMHELCEC